MRAQILDGSCSCQLTIQEVGREQCISGKDFDFSPKNYGLLHYIYAGKGTFSFRGVERYLRSGDLFYIPKNSIASYLPDKRDPWSYFWVGFAGDSFESLLLEAGIDGENPVFHDEKRLIKPLFEKLHDSYLNAGTIDLTVLGNGYCLLDALVKCASSSDPKRKDVSPHVISAKQFILNNYDQQISLEDIASSVGVTPNYLCNIFKEAGETSPKNYLLKMRMEKAAALLTDGSRSVAQVAERVGYNSPIRFSIAFNQFYGISPREFQKKAMKK